MAWSKHPEHGLKLHITLIQFGFVLAKADQSLFTGITSYHSTFIIVCIDDILVTCSNIVMIEELIFKLNMVFALKDLGEINYFLGIQVKNTKEGLHLSQTKYLTTLLYRAKMQGAKGICTPMVYGKKPFSHGSEGVRDAQLYRLTVGALQDATMS